MCIEMEINKNRNKIDVYHNFDNDDSSSNYSIAINIDVMLI